MEAIKIMALALVGVMLALVLKEQKQFASVALVIMLGICMFFMILPYFEKVTSYIKVIYTSFSNDGLMNILLKVTGIGILTSLTSDLCRDAGFSAVASLVVFSGKAICMCIVLPVIGSFFTQLMSIIP